MDTKRVSDQQHIQNLLTSYRHKFSKQKFALIATADDAAFRFALEFGPELFPNVPLVFCGVNNFDPALIAGRTNVTGILEEVDVADTLSTALALHPNTKQVYIVNDMSESGIGLRKKINEAITHFADRVSFIFLDNYSLAQLTELERNLPPASIMFRCIYFIDKNGQVLPDEVASLSAIGSKAPVPVYSLWDFFLGLGIVGGKLVSGTSQGETAAILAGQILDGKPASSIPIVTESPNPYMFDYHQMQRFGINKASLPLGSVIINGPEPFYAVEKPILWLGAIFTISITITSLLLFLAIRRRRQTEEILRNNHERLLEQQVTLAGLIRSDVFTGEEMDKAIRYLVDVGAWQLGVARASIWLFNSDRSYLRCIDLYELASDSHSCSFDLHATDYPVYFSALAAEEIVAANDAAKHPLLKEFATVHLLSLGISSRLDVPIHLYRQPVGVLCLEHIGPSIAWSAEQRFFASALANLAALVIEQHERRKAEQSLRRAEAKFRELFNNAGDAIIIHDLEGRILEVNKKMCDRLNYTHDELLAKTVAQINTPEQAPFVAQRIEATLTGDKVIYETEHLRRDNFKIPVEVNSRIIDYEGQPAMLSIIRNISARKEMERLKDEMLSAVSHELRTPLTTIMGYSSFMLDNLAKDEEQKEYLQTIYNATRRLEELINNFLDLQRLKASHGPFDVSPIPLPPLLEEIVSLFANTSAKHTLEIDCPTNLPSILGDGEQLLQVLNNLVSNAFKFSPNGGMIVIKATQQGDNIIIQVSDEGIGIAPDAQEMIFDKFYRVDNSDRRRVGGTGLGLALVKEIINLHHGNIWVESSLGSGSTFFISLPIAQESPSNEDSY